MIGGLRRDRLSRRYEGFRQPPVKTQPPRRANFSIGHFANNVVGKIEGGLARLPHNATQFIEADGGVRFRARNGVANEIKAKGATIGCAPFGEFARTVREARQPARNDSVHLGRQPRRLPGSCGLRGRPLAWRHQGRCAYCFYHEERPTLCLLIQGHSFSAGKIALRNSRGKAQQGTSGGRLAS